MIVKNEEDVLERCLSSVKDLVDEIIIVDTGSTDRTKEIARVLADKVYRFPWVDDFSAARNFSFKKATKDYILWLDADDIMFPDEAVKFRNLKETLPPDIDAVMMGYHTGFDEQGQTVFSYLRERMVKRSRHFQWREPIHEYMQISGKVMNADVYVTHAKQHQQTNTRNMEIYESLLAKGDTLSPRGMYYYAREMKDNGRIDAAADMFNRFLESGLGWVEDNISACGELAKCYQSKKEHSKALEAMLRSFHYDMPRAELCCQIGYHFKELGDYRRAAFWFDLALHLEKSGNSWGFHQEDCWGYIPSIECSACYDQLGDYDRAERYNDMAASYKPDSSAVLHNKKYFESKRQGNAIKPEKGE
jgi:glycosyltransferase involved in cell wall biosynthesis